MRTPTSTTLLSLVVVLVALLAWSVVPVRADDEDGGPQRTISRIDLGAYRVHVPPPSPRLVLPSDAAPDMSWVNSAPDEETRNFFSFTEREVEGYVVPPDDLIEFLREYLSAYFDEYQLDESHALDGGISLVGYPEAVRAAKEASTWLLDGFAPHLRASAVLTREGDEPRLLAAGNARLWPDLWTQVFFQHGDTPIAGEWEIEIAQESTSMHPVVIQVPEGEELYLRYHPGISVSLVEVWVGHLKHMEMRDVDLSVIRNVPETSAPGTLTLPQTAGYRTYTAFVVPSGAASTRELAWNGPAGPVRLRLAFDPASALHEMRRIPRSDTKAYEQVLRVGALASALEFDRRPASGEAIVDRLRMRDEANSYMYYGSGLLRWAGERASGMQAKEHILAAERRLRTHTARLRTLTAGEGGVRRALVEGGLEIGGAVDPAVLEALADRSGTAVTGDVTLPLLEGIEASLRAGLSVTGLTHVDSEVAQQSGGNDPGVGARFDGVYGNVRVVSTGDGTRLYVNVHVDWAKPDGGQVTLVYRPPVGVKSERDAYGTADGSVRLPVLSGGEAIFTNSALAPDSGAEVLLGIATRGTEAILLLGSVRR